MNLIFSGTSVTTKETIPEILKSTRSNYDDTNHNLVQTYIEERRRNERESEGINGNFGIELYLDKTSSWTNTLAIRKNNGSNPEDVIYNNYSEVDTIPFTKTQRFNNLKQTSLDVEYSTNYTKKFKKEGHKLTIDGSFSDNKDNDNSIINGNGLFPFYTFISSERTFNNQKQQRNLIQSDYVLPIGKDSQFEAGFRGNYSTLLTIYEVDTLKNNIFIPNNLYTNTLEYKENVTAFYTQFGSKINKFSYLLGLRFEGSNIKINQLTSQDFNTKKYNNLFPSAFLTYEIGQGNNISISYSKRISRPRDRFINPFSSYSSNISIFQGNPDLNPSLSDAYDLGYLKKWDKITLSTSLYYNMTKDAVQIVSKEGNKIGNSPIVISTPFNLADDDKLGFEFTVNYAPFKWWKLNGNFNYYNEKTSGTYRYLKSSGETETIDFDNSSATWFARLTSKFNLPYKIDMQANGTYNAAQKVAQGTNKANASANFALSKDVLKDKATIAFNINDVFNSRKRINDVHLPTTDNYSEMQWRQRQFTLSFTYRFNKQKTDRDKQPKKDPNGDNGNDDYQGQ